MTDIIKDSIRGCLVAGAAGDALGYEVEFMRRNNILKRFGPSGITRFELNRHGLAEISDDTQMTLFTAAGLLEGIARGLEKPEQYVDKAYLDWYYTQTGKDGGNPPFTPLRDILELHSQRAPGGTCMSACASMLFGIDVDNNSKGCGGIMRVAPVACLMAGYDSRGERHYTEAEMDEAGAYTARLTHQHPLGFLPAAMLTHIIYKLLPLTSEQGREKIWAIAEGTIASLDAIYPEEFPIAKKTLAELTRQAVNLAREGADDAEAISALGEGWVGEEAWAIGLYCALRHIDSPADAIIAAVNHDGDSDSTGSVCGNIIGALYGYNHLRDSRIFCPDGKDLASTLELHDLILTIADQLYAGTSASSL